MRAKNTSRKPRKEQAYVAVIGDLVGSRGLPGAKRRKAQIDLKNILEALNRKWAGGIHSEFRISQGDQFEALLNIGMAHAILPDLFWQLEGRLATRARFGIGLGPIDTDLSVDPGLVDGPAFHRARAAVQWSRQESREGGVFEGFGIWNEILNGFARLLHEQRRGWSKRQREIVNVLETAESVTEAAERLGISKQAVSEHARAAGWRAYREGDNAFWHAVKLACEAAVKEQP